MNGTTEYNQKITYTKATKTLVFNLLASIPLLLMYEWLLFFYNNHNVGIAVDIWIKQFFSMFHPNAYVIFIFLCFCAVVYFIIKDRQVIYSFRWRYGLYITLESIGWAFVLSTTVVYIINTLFTIMIQATPINTLSLMEQLALSFGAGLYEELFFRVLLISLLLFVLRYYMSNLWARCISIVISAILFSLVHYIGVYGDEFTISSFLFRFLFALMLNAIYVWRGFCVAAWSHTFYDIFYFLLKN